MIFLFVFVAERSEFGVPLNCPPVRQLSSAHNERMCWQKGENTHRHLQRIPFCHVRLRGRTFWRRLYCEHRRDIQFNGVPTALGILTRHRSIWATQSSSNHQDARGALVSVRPAVKQCWQSFYQTWKLMQKLHNPSHSQKYKFVIFILSCSRYL